jgi:hypothetical protein
LRQIFSGTFLRIDLQVNRRQLRVQKEIVLFMVVSKVWGRAKELNGKNNLFNK